MGKFVHIMGRLLPHSGYMVEWGYLPATGTPWRLAVPQES